MLIKKISLGIICLFLSSFVFANSYLLFPTGPYNVGYQDLRLVNGSKVNESYQCPGKMDLLYTKGEEQDYGIDNQANFCREIMLRVYYPTYKQSSPGYSAYYQLAMIDMQHMIAAAKVPGVTESDLEALEDVKSFTIENSNIVNQKFPVLIFDPGSGIEAQQYENVITNLVSNGYIVLALNNTFVGASILFPDGRLVHNRTDLASPSILPKADNAVLNDILFIRDQLNNSLSPFAKFLPYMQLNHIGLLGHSMGAISVVAMIRTEPQLFQAALSLDAPPTKLGQRVYSSSELAGFPNTPFMRLFAAEWRNLGGIVTPANAHFQLFKNNYYVLLSPSETDTNYTGHMSFSDLSTLQYLKAIHLFIQYSDPDIIGTADGWQEATLLNNYILQFFNRYLKNIPSENLSNCVSLSEDSLLSCDNINKPQSK